MEYYAPENLKPAEYEAFIEGPNQVRINYVFDMEKRNRVSDIEIPARLNLESC